LARRIELRRLERVDQPQVVGHADLLYTGRDAGTIPEKSTEEP
jgi:hypothetical protein